MAESVLILGAGMGGLFTALALKPSERMITILERDPPPPAGVEEAFQDWRRRGVGQLRHSHGFLSRLRDVIKRRHPALIDALRDAGCREIVFTDMMPPALRETYAPEPGDEDIVILSSRRTTFELVLRHYVEALAGVTLVSNAFARELILAAEPGAPIRVDGARGELDGAAREWRADLVVDAQGRLSDAREQLIAAGAVIPEEAESCGIVYFTRHYRRTGVEPAESRTPGNGDLDYLKFGRFPGDNGCFSITLAAPEIEEGLRQALVRPEVFDEVCARLPGLAPWLDPAISEPISRVFGMGELTSRWRRFVNPDQRALHGYFAVGDALIRSNPLYGRGCSFAAVESELLGQVLDETDEPAERARLYDSRVREALRPFYEDMREQDRAAIRRAEQARDPAYRSPLRARLLKSFVDNGVGPAVRGDVRLLRAAVREFNMVDPPRAWVRKPENLVKLVGRWARARPAEAAPPPLGPRRAEMLAALGLA